MKTITKLKEIASYAKGSQINGDDLVENGKYEYLNGGINPSGRWNDYNTPGGTVTISEGGNSCGYVNYMEKPFWCGAHCYYLYNTVKNVRYLYYALKSQQDRLMRVRSGACMPNIKKADLGAFELYFDTDEGQQQRIVSVLQKAERVISARQQELQTLDNLIKARFVELFGTGHDGKCTSIFIGDHCKFQQGTQIPVELQVEEYKAGYKRFLRIIDYTQAPQPPRYVCVDGREIDTKSVVVVRYGATAGFVGRGYSGILANNLFEVVPDESVISKDFLYLALKYGTFERDIHEKAFGAAMPALSFSMMNDIPLVAPTLGEQRAFVDFYEQVDKSKVVVQKALDETQLLFDSLMQKYFG